MVRISALFVCFVCAMTTVVLIVMYYGSTSVEVSNKKFSMDLNPSPKDDHSVMPPDPVADHSVMNPDPVADHSVMTPDPVADHSVMNPDPVADHAVMNPDPVADHSVMTPGSTADHSVMNPAMSPITKPALYAVTLTLDGQQGSGMVSMAFFQCFLTSLLGSETDVLIAEPQVKDSYFKTYVKNLHLNFSSFLDLDYFNEQSRKLGYPRVVNLDEFSSQSPRHAIYIHLRRSKSSVQKLVWQAEGGKKGISCFGSEVFQDLSESYSSSFKKVQASHNIFSRKCVVRVVELWVIEFWDGKRSLSVSKMRDFIFGEWSPSEVTLVFSSWYFYMYAPLDVPPNGLNCLKANKYENMKVQFRPSKRLLQEAVMYRDTFLGGENKLALMLRVERVATKYAHGKFDIVKKCVDEVSGLKRAIVNDSNPVVTLDVGGKYGTGSYRPTKAIKDLSRKTLSSLYNNKWSVEEWEQSFVTAAGGVTDRGYIAALQRVLASRADCLVLMGGGDFQAVATMEYKQHHNSSDCLHLVCVGSKFLKDHYQPFYV